MSALQNTARHPSATGGEHNPSTIVLVAVANVAQPEEGVGIVKRFSGQDLIDLFHEVDRPDSNKAIVGVQLAIPPELNGTSRWIAEAIVDIARVRLFSADAQGVDTYAYRLATNAVYRDSVKVEPSDIFEWRSLYELSRANGVDDLELAAHQTWLSTVITRMLNAVNLSVEATES
ncbi:hypothetical protein [Pseudomonas jessenii]|uniref:hypothetical protein n=1 Tax=Pseudomonas jessenii TaxID=77298 RepID=UPI0032E4F75A